MQNIIIIGATSGIGKILAEMYAAMGNKVGITGRRESLLVEIQRKYPEQIVYSKMDVTQVNDSLNTFEQMVSEMGKVDIVIVNAGVGLWSDDWKEEQDLIMTNVLGFTAMAKAAYNLFRSQKHGHLVGISSVASERGFRISSAYSASKAFVSNYLEGLHHRSQKKGGKIYVTDIRPGFVETPMTEKNEKMFWVATVEKASKQIISAIRAKKRKAYITKRWWIIAKILRHTPGFLYYRT